MLLRPVLLVNTVIAGETVQLSQGQRLAAGQPHREYLNLLQTTNRENPRKPASSRILLSMVSLTWGVACSPLQDVSRLYPILPLVILGP